MRQQVASILKDLETSLDPANHALVAAAIERHFFPQPKTGFASPDAPGSNRYTVHLGASVHYYGGPAGWSAVFAGGEEFSGGDKAATMNRIAVQAVCAILSATPVASTVVIHTANAAVSDLIQRHHHGKAPAIAEFETLKRLEAERQVEFLSCSLVPATRRAVELARYAADAAAEGMTEKQAS